MSGSLGRSLVGPWSVLGRSLGLPGPEMCPKCSENGRFGPLWDQRGRTEVEFRRRRADKVKYPKYRGLGLLKTRFSKGAVAGPGQLGGISVSSYPDFAFLSFFSALRTLRSAFCRKQCKLRGFLNLSA